MAKNKPKFYVVWVGETPGVYRSWDDCKLQTQGFPEAKYKAFPSLLMAENAFADGWEQHYGKSATDVVQDKMDLGLPFAAFIQESICVDAACSGNPGKMEYRGVDLKTGLEIFRQGPFEQGTNNIGEFLAIVHALALVKNYEHPIPIYSDSKIAIGWIRDKSCRTKLEPNAKNAPVFNLVARAEKWLRENEYKNKVLKWKTEIWGEIPADFGRK